MNEFKVTTSYIFIILYKKIGIFDQISNYCNWSGAYPVHYSHKIPIGGSYKGGGALRRSAITCLFHSIWDYESKWTLYRLFSAV